MSVVVVSRHRPAELALCLGALALQDHRPLEVVLVADPEGLKVRPDLPLKRIGFDAPNISAARNAGIAAAAGAVVAFIDDDAVAEPTWAGRLAAAFRDPEVIAATGWTLGPWGRRWQVRAEAITPRGPVPLPIEGQATRLYRPADGTVLSTLGTNCVFRRHTLIAIGGFDPAFPWHLDESDLNLRLAAAFPHAASALVPRARVTHGSAPSARRDAARVPRDLTRIGRSEAIFARRHGGEATGVVAVQRRRLLRHMLAGRLDPQRVGPLLASLAAGLAEAADPPLPAPLPDAPPPAFLPLATRPRPHRLIGGWAWHRRRLRAAAAAAAAEGAAVTLLLLIPGTMPHRQRFHPGGWWEQSGGVMGPSNPDDPPLIGGSRAARERREFAQLEEYRASSRQPEVAS
nr:glycosyltransferase [Paracoccus sp. S-4012]